MLPQVVTYALIAANAALIVTSTTPAAAGALTLAAGVTTTATLPLAGGGGQIISTTTQTLDTGRRVLVTYGSEASARTVKITGGNQAGNPITETLTIPASAAGSVATQQDFLTITQVYAGSAFTNPITVGTNGTGSCPWLAVTTMVTPVNFGVTCVVNGTVTYSVEYTNDDPNFVGLSPATIPNPFALIPLYNQSASVAASIDQPFKYWRLTILAGTGSVTATGISAGVYQ